VKLIRKRAFARAGLVGNPSDGYGGKTLAVPIRNYWADVVLYEWDDVEVIPSQQDRGSFRNVQELVTDVQLHGYYGGIRLVKATIKRFVEYCGKQGYHLHDRNFSVRYESNVPRQVGLAGSSAIIVATLRCLLDFYEIEIPLAVQPSLALSVETEELGIAAGLQDRVVQCYETLVWMDFAPGAMRKLGGLQCGTYESLDASLLPPLYIAHLADAGEPTEVVHNDLRARYRQGDPAVHAAMQRLAELAQSARDALVAGNRAALARIMNENYDIRASICRIAPRQAEMVRRARAAGAAAKFPGSGGAIVGTYADEATFQALVAAMAEMGCETIRARV
jgi:glucuronokinase